MGKDYVMKWKLIRQHQETRWRIEELKAEIEVLLEKLEEIETKLRQGE